MVDVSVDFYMALIVVSFFSGFGSALGMEFAKYLIAKLKERRHQITEVLNKKG